MATSAREYSPAIEDYLKAIHQIAEASGGAPVQTQALADRLHLIAERGYDSALDELDYGIVSVAVPIFGQGRRVIASINCSTSTTRISQDELVRTRLPLLRQAAGEIEGALRRWPALEASLRP